MTALEVLHGVDAAGGRLIPRGEKLRMEFPTEPPAPLLEAIRARKYDLLVLLRGAADTHALPDPFGPLPTDPADADLELVFRARLREPELARATLRHPVDGDAAGALRLCHVAAASVIWTAGGSEDLARRRAAQWNSISLDLLAGRRISFRPPAEQPAIGEWVRTTHGTIAEVLACDAASCDVLARALVDPPRWGWFRPDALVSEMDWPLQQHPKRMGGCQ